MSRPSLAEIDSLLSLYEQLLALPDHVTGEIIDGELFAQPRPAGRHVNAETGLGAVLRFPFQKGKDGPGGWWILAEPEVHFVRDTVVAVPDLAGWRRERMPAIQEEVWEILGRLARSSEEIDRRTQETDQRMQETDRMIKEMNRSIGRLGNRLGEFVEEW